MTSEKFKHYEFESVVILSLEKAETQANVNSRKRAIPAIIGVTAQSIVR